MGRARMDETFLMLMGVPVWFPLGKTAEISVNWYRNKSIFNHIHEKDQEIDSAGLCAMSPFS